MFCLLALVTGGVLAMWAPVGQFAVGLLVIALAGFAFALSLDMPLWTTIGWSLGLFACAQVGYGLGAAATVLARMRFQPPPTRDGKSRSAARALPGSFPK